MQNAPLEAYAKTTYAPVEPGKPPSMLAGNPQMAFPKLKFLACLICAGMLLPYSTAQRSLPFARLRAPGRGWVWCWSCTGLQPVISSMSWALTTSQPVDLLRRPSLCRILLRKLKMGCILLRSPERLIYCSVLPGPGPSGSLGWRRPKLCDLKTLTIHRCHHGVTVAQQ